MNSFMKSDISYPSQPSHSYTYILENLLCERKINYEKKLQTYPITLLEFSLAIPRFCCKVGLHLQFLKYVCAPHQSPVAGN